MQYEEMKTEGNVSTVIQFVLLGFSDLLNFQGLLFVLFFIVYMIILIGNSLIIIVTRIDTALQKPMYFFLANFSSLEICYVSVTLPRILKNLWTQDRRISTLGCATQLCFFLIFGATECFLLAVMSYDRYVAICNPLHYPLVMNHKRCVQLAVGAWVIGIPVQIGQTCQIFSLLFCTSNQINHFFCDIPPILKLACGDTFIHELSVYVVAMLFVAVPFILILISYGKIISTILRLPTAKGRAKAFSICSSHLIVVVLFFGSATITYLRPKSNHSAATDKLLSLFYTIVTPMFNPLIYSLRNKDMTNDKMKAEGNVSSVTQFVLLGFSDLLKLQGLLFGLFSITYMVILIGNSLIIIVTRIDTALQKPMYFLANFSSLEICYVSVTLPRILKNLWTQDRTISILGCATQLCFFLIFGATECFLLAVMSYDRYVAICNPLHYPLVMNHKLCVQLAVVPFLLILGSYIKIISTILKLPSNTSHFKAFSTCSSHLVVVVLFFGSACTAYLRPKSNHSALTDKLLSLFYTIVTPMLNPLIYSLRNKDMPYDKMKSEDNVSSVMQFVLMGFYDLPKLQGLLFGIFAMIYIIILIGNSLIIIVTRIDTALQKPMYFFLANFSSLEICYVSVTLPRILKNLWTQDRSMSKVECATQMCFFLMLGTTECFLLAVMSYDRYVAICNPLHYPLVMNHKMCVQLAIGAWLTGIPIQIGQTCLIFSLHFCHSNQINHFFCDIPPVIKVACGDTSLHEIYVYVAALVIVAIPFTLILFSYGKIISTILKLPTASGRAKAFSTCSSHLIVVVLFFGSASITYFRPKSNHSALTDKLLSLFYTIVTPMFNPLIYSLRNKDMKEEENLTRLMEFVLLDFADVPQLQWFLFTLFLFIYIIILLGNGTIFLITKVDPTLQTPMYIFLGNFSFLEICYVSVTIPRMLTNLWTQRRMISLVACADQMCCILVLGATECFLLAVMAYDRYMAICKPLRYTLVMNHKFCVQLVAGSWVGGIPVQIGQTFQIFSLPFCSSNHINHFFCDIPPILQLACGDTLVNQMMVYIVAVLFVTVPFLLILVSYGKIISTILKLQSATSRSKAFSTCSSHLIVVILQEQRRMEKENCSTNMEFIFLGITNNPEEKVTLFTIFLVIYLITVVANLGMIFLIRMDSQLHTPMYFFLSHLAFCDLCYSTAVGPKMLVDIFAKNKSIPFLGCALQFFVFCIFADAECLLLAVMAYDRYQAISNPLLYTVNMSSRVCYLLVAGVYMVGGADALTHTTLTFRLCFCGSNKVNHFFCDLPPLYIISCSDIEVNELALFTVFGFIELSTISGVLVSYCYIFLSVLKIRSAEGRFKAFSTCTSHLTAVAIFQGTMLFMYFRPSSAYSLDQDKMASLFYTLVIPMLNPLIYSLRNKDVKDALVKLKTKRVRRMDRKNCSLDGFVLLGFTNNPEKNMTLFTILLIIYLINVLANIGMIFLIRMDSQLHTPMYFFLSHLSFYDLCYSTAVGPKTLVSLVSANKSIPFFGCALQFFVFCFFIDSECLLLAVMAFDRYQAISNPLLYTVNMSSRVCYLLVAGVYMVGGADALTHTTLTFRLCFCGSNKVNHFFCEVPPLLLLSCSDTQVNELAIFTVFGFIELSTISGVLVSYCYIFLSVLKIRSAEGRFKAFSTCTSHLTAVAIFQGTMLFMYFRPSSAYSLDQDKMASLFYTLVIPMLNPLIYSLRNKDVKDALVKLKTKVYGVPFIGCHAYDLHVVICTHICTHLPCPGDCIQLVVVAYTAGLVESAVYTCFTLQLSFSNSSIINHFCDTPPLLALSSSYTHIKKMLLLILNSFVVGCSIITVLLLYSYFSLLYLCLALEGCGCISWHTAVHVLLIQLKLFHGQNDLIFHTVIIPMLNPVIYSSRNKDAKGVLKSQRRMERGNCSSVTHFIFLGITSNPDNKMILFAVFLIIYLITVVANIGMIFLIRMDSQLHTPMYFFLSHLAFCDLCYSTAVGPKMLVDIFAKNRSISLLGCALQFFFFCIFIDSECVLLAVMAYDRYQAISNPLLYTVNMSSRVCFLLLVVVYTVALGDALTHTTLTFRLCFCGSNKVNHFFCDLPPLYIISCSDIEVNELALFTVFGFIELSTISGVLVSYCYIFLSVLKIRSAEGRFKAFSTCTSHLTAVAIFQGTMLFMYFRPSSAYSLDQDKMASLFYTLVIPMLNPLIYSLRNKDVKDALVKLKTKNCTVLTESIFVGLSGRQDVQQGLFVLFLLVYGITAITSLGMIWLIKVDPRLHMSMYYFLSNLSFCDLVAITYIAGMVDSAIHNCPTFQLSFCNPNIINHFFCDIPPLLALSTSDTSVNEILLFTFGSFILGCSIITILLSYSYIIVTILRMNSAEGRRKAFSTCTSHLMAMTAENCTVFTEFIFIGLSGRQDVQQGLFVFFLLVYGITVIANLGMILLIKVDPRLHTPMYYFLSNLSFCDICYSSSVSLKMLADFLSEHKKIPCNLCAVQMWSASCWLSWLMTVAMSRRLSIQLVAITYIAGMVDSAVYTTLIFQLTFCTSNIINHFFCDIPPLLALSTSDTSFHEILLFTVGSFILGCSIITVLLSYSYIIVTILRMNSAEGRHKAFSTCTSHLMAVAVFHGTLLYMYFRPSSSYSMDTDKMTSVFYTVVIPMLNPLIYSLRNKDVKDALKKMTTENCTLFSEFIFVGLSGRQDVQQGLFVFFLLVYGITVIANLGMILLIKVDPRFHTPMYYFLSNLSFCDICYSSSVSLKMLADFLSEHKKIPYNLCPIQMYIFGAFADVECRMLAVMAYDRYVAICNPLLYAVTMSRRLCTQLVVISYTVGLVDSAIHTCLAFRLLFCTSNIINHFFCDIPPILALSTSDTLINEIVMFTFIGCVVGSSIITVLLSYSYIIVTILRMNSAEGRRKAFSTCTSHLVAVAIFHGTLLFMYFRPSSSYSMDTDKMASVFYTVIIPMLNPLIYSLRNKDVKGALKKAIGMELCSG
ncbi:Olfactory receptor 5W2 [Galemys pyrenaicus]|uniref:Olfactory receptor 5W2 n=1 Tax=Galemys pyrenaicus TaxID=202257 RepID=A0A8J6A7B9_GALPY|nr:Olfactory receptor 5W2 [Galemys pyrenaicus]